MDRNGPYALPSVAPYKCRAFTIPGGDETGQDALDGAAVELIEDLRIQDKYFQFHEGVKVLSCMTVFMTS